KGPVAARVFEHAQIDFAHQNFFFVVRSLGDDSSKRIAEKRSAPKLQSRARGGVLADVAGLKAHPVHHRDIHSVGDSMRPLDGLPRLMLRGAKLSLLRWMPTNGRGIEQHLRSLQRC